MIDTHYHLLHKRLLEKHEQVVQQAKQSMTAIILFLPVYFIMMI